MKHTRRRRHLRPQPSRSQLNLQLDQARRTMQLFQVGWLVEASQESPSLRRLRLLHDAVVTLRDDIADMERL